MTENFALPEVPRGECLNDTELRERWALASPQIDSVIDGETDAVALQATLACVLYAVFTHATWVGFYRLVRDNELAVGPYQGSLGCLRIGLDRGVCGAAARTQTPQRVRDVRCFVGHIACDASTLSELVVPVFDHHGELRAVLDLDARELDAFSAWQCEVLTELCARVFSRAEVNW